MRYEKYKEMPEAVWFISVPANWRATKMREVFSERNTKVSDKDYPALSVGKMGVTPQLDTAVKTDNGDNRKLILKGDFAINSRSDRKGSSGISQYDGSASLIITVLKPHHELNGRFYHYLLRSHYFIEEFYRSGHGLVSDLWTTKWDEMRNIYIPVPPREEQDQIVRYLDWKVSRINTLIHGYQRQIKLLEERRQTVIDRAVLEGIAGAKLKDSGTHWMKKIPVHWEIKKIKYQFDEISDKGHPDEVPLVASQNMGVVPKDVYGQRTVVASKGLELFKKVEIGDFVISLRSFQGGLEYAYYEGIISPAYTILRNKNAEFSGYFKYLFKSVSFIKLLTLCVTGIREGQNIDYQALKQNVIPIPPQEEQNQIVRYLDQKLDCFNMLIHSYQRQIALFQEYRTRLISDAVTGQTDVRHVSVPDYVPEDDMGKCEADEGWNDEEVATDE